MTALERLLECVNALLCLMGLGEKGFKVLGEECFSVLLYAVDKLISLYGSHHINISTYQHINP